MKYIHAIKSRNGLSNASIRTKGYTDFIALKKGILKKTDLDDVRVWVEERVAAMPFMEVQIADVSGKGWIEQRTAEKKRIKKITGEFFTIEGRSIQVKRDDGDLVWTQPGIIQSQIPVTIPTPDGEVNVLASDLIGIIKDREGNVLLTVGQGVFAKTEKHAKVRTPFQTSAGKARGILMEGKTELDPIFSETIEILGVDQTLEEMFASGELEVFPLGEADENRIDATNVGFVTTVLDNEIREKLKAGGKNRWCAPDEVHALARAGLINGHTAAALLAA